MLIPPSHLRNFFRVTPVGTLHVGAHLGEEAREYHSQGFGPLTWVEAQGHLIDALVEATRAWGDRVIHAAVWSESGIDIDLNISSNSQSTSLFDFSGHLSEYPDISFVRQEVVTTVRLDEVLPSDESFDLVCLDIQGAELEALKGLGRRLSEVKWVYSEVNCAHLYRGIPLVDELDRYLENHGFARVVTVWTTHGWGEALYARGESRQVKNLRTIGVLYSLLAKASVWGLAKRISRLTKRTLDRIYSLLMRKRIKNNPR